MRNLIITLLISALTVLAMPLAADYSKQKMEADQLYQNGDFAKAYKKYRTLAREGDSFSQHRLSWMFLMGEGQKEDVIESLAWSVLAAQDRQAEKVAYMQTIAGMVPQQERKKANKKINYFMRKWGKGKESGSRRGESECTGSRLCNHKTKSSNAGVPSNLWNVSNNTPKQELKTRAMDINETILESGETG